MKITPAFCCFLLFFATEHAQTQILLGPEIGAQYSWITFNDRGYKDSYSVQPHTGYHAGVKLSVLVHKRFFLHTSILYSTKGKTIKGKSDELLRNEVNYRYIDIPLLYTVDFKFNLKGTKVFNYYLGLGPNISYWLGGKGTIYTSDFNELDIPERSYSVAFGKTPEAVNANEMGVEDPNRVQLGLNLATGAVFEPFGYQRIALTVRYELGHSFFSRTSNGIFADTYYQDVLQSRNKGIRVSLAYLVDLGIEQRKKGKSTIKQRRL